MNNLLPKETALVWPKHFEFLPLVGLGTRLAYNCRLAHLLTNELKANLENSPFTFASQQKGCLMKTFQSGNFIVTVVVNKSSEIKHIEMVLKNKNLKFCLPTKAGQFKENS